MSGLLLMLCSPVLSKVSLAGCILLTCSCTTSLLRSSHDFSVPWALSFLPLFFSPLKTAAETLLLVQLHWFLGRYFMFTAVIWQSDSQTIFTHPYNLEFVLCCLFSEINSPYSKCQGGTSGQREHQLLCKLILRLHGLWTQIMWQLNAENIAGTSALCRQTK